MNLKALKYETFEKINTFIAKHFGLVEDHGHYCIPTSWYVCDRDYEDDKIVEYEAVRGWQIFPIIKKVEQFDLGHCGLYRSYIKERIQKEGQ